MDRCTRTVDTAGGGVPRTVERPALVHRAVRTFALVREPFRFRCSHRPRAGPPSVHNVTPPGPHGVHTSVHRLWAALVHRAPPDPMAAVQDLPADAPQHLWTTTAPGAVPLARCHR